MIGHPVRLLYRSYDDAKAPLSNSYARLDKLVALIQFDGRKDKCHG
jgi:hypothetical protein